MKSLFTVLLVLSVITAVLADTNPCQSTLERVKSASRLANAWRAACEDSNWRGASCYNYWAQATELLNLETYLQACNVQYYAGNRQLMLGDNTRQGLIYNDTTATYGVQSPAAQAEVNLVQQQYVDLRTLETNTENNVIANLTATISQSASDDQTAVSTDAQSRRTHVSNASNDLRAFVDGRTQDEITADKQQSDSTRTTVSQSHASTRATIQAEEKLVANVSQTFIISTTNDLMTYQVGQSSLTNTLVHSEADSTRQRVNTEATTTQSTVSAEASNTRATVSAEQTNTRSVVSSTTETIISYVNSDATVSSNTVDSVQANVRANVSATAAGVRNNFSALQTLLVASLQGETTQLNNLISQALLFVTHLDAENGRMATGDTNYFATPQAFGGNIEQLRSVVLDAITYNENNYGTNKCGYSRSYFNTGDQYSAVRDFRRAATYYRAAYNEAVQSH